MCLSRPSCKKTFRFHVVKVNPESTIQIVAGNILKYLFFFQEYKKSSALDMPYFYQKIKKTNKKTLECAVDGALSKIPMLVAYSMMDRRTDLLMHILTIRGGHVAQRFRRR